MKFRLDCRLPFPADLFWSIRATPGFMNFVVEDGLLRAMTGTTSTPAAGARALDGVLPATDRLPAAASAAAAAAAAAAGSAAASASEADTAAGSPSGERPRLQDIRTRQQTYTPARVEMPDLVRGIVGQTLFEVTDTQTWDASPGAPTVQAFRITPSFLSSLCTTAGVLSVRPAPPPGAPDLVDMPQAEGGGDASGGGSGDDALPSPPVGVPAVPTVGGAPITWCTHTVDGTARVRLVGVGVWVERAMLHNLSLFYAEYPATIDRFRMWLLRRHGRPGDGGGDAALGRAVWRFRVSEGGEFAPPSPPVSLAWRRPAAVAVTGAAAGVSPARAADASGSEDGDASSREGAGGWSEYHSVATDDSDYASAVESAVGGPPAVTAVSAASGSGWTSDGASGSDSDSDSDSDCDGRSDPQTPGGVPPCRCTAAVAAARGGNSRRAQTRGAGPPRRRRSLTPLPGAGAASDADIDDVAAAAAAADAATTVHSSNSSSSSSGCGAGSGSDIGSAATAGSVRSGGSGRLPPRRHHRKAAASTPTAVAPDTATHRRHHRRRRRAAAAAGVGTAASLSPARSALSIGVEELMGGDALPPPPSPPPPSPPPPSSSPPLSALRSSVLWPVRVRAGGAAGRGGGRPGGPAARACRVAVALAAVSAVVVLVARAGGRGDGWASDDGSEDGW